MFEQDLELDLVVIDDDVRQLKALSNSCKPYFANVHITTNFDADELAILYPDAAYLVDIISASGKPHGLRVLERLNQLDPRMPMWGMSGDPAYEADVRELGHQFIHKPLQPIQFEAMRDQIRAAAKTLLRKRPEAQLKEDLRPRVVLSAVQWLSRVLHHEIRNLYSLISLEVSREQPSIEKIAEINREALAVWSRIYHYPTIFETSETVINLGEFVSERVNAIAALDDPNHLGSVQISTPEADLLVTVRTGPFETAIELVTSAILAVAEVDQEGVFLRVDVEAQKREASAVVRFTYIGPWLPDGVHEVMLIAARKDEAPPVHQDVRRLLPYYLAEIQSMTIDMKVDGPRSTLEFWIK